MVRAALVGALVGVAFFLLATLLEGGLRPCVQEAIWQGAYDIVNGPAELLAVLWPDPAVAPQQQGAVCVTTLARAWDAEAFAVLGGAVYGGIAAVVAAIGRLALGTE